MVGNPLGAILPDGLGEPHRHGFLSQPHDWALNHDASARQAATPVPLCHESLTEPCEISLLVALDPALVLQAHPTAPREASNAVFEMRHASHAETPLDDPVPGDDLRLGEGALVQTAQSTPCCKPFRVALRLRPGELPGLSQTTLDLVGLQSVVPGVPRGVGVDHLAASQAGGDRPGFAKEDSWSLGWKRSSST